MNVDRNKQVRLDWVPLKGVGPFMFEEAIASYIDNFGLIEVPEGDDEITNWSNYEMPGYGIDLYVEDGKIVSICCEYQCFFRGKNLIGLTLQEVIEVVGLEPEKDVDTIELADDGEQLVYEFDDAALQLWTKDGVAVAVFCGPAYDD